MLLSRWGLEFYSLLRGKTSQKAISCIWWYRVFRFLFVLLLIPGEHLLIVIPFMVTITGKTFF